MADDGKQATEVGPPAGTRRIPGTLLQQGARIERFVVERRLGEGGAGVVVLARDTDLDRLVAIKLLRPVELADDGGLEARARLLREAQAIARLKHPNVVTVYQTGEVAGQVFLAMEYVPGGTLREWLAAARPGWKEIVRRFRLAGRGLAAAHAAGMVHRDFKPDNVLVAEDGNALVTDFGLVGAPRRGDAADVEPGGASLTRTGAVMGTPCYMAPEQARGGELDARVDQFSFCAALYEALCGQLPFAGASAAEIAAEIETGRVRRPPRGTRAPAWLLAIVLRGLRPDPAARHRSMEALLRALEPERRFARRIALTAAIAIVAGGVAVSWAVTRRDDGEGGAAWRPPGGPTDAAASTCEAPDARLAPVEPGRVWLYAGGELVRDGDAAPRGGCAWRALEPEASLALVLDYSDPRCCGAGVCGPPPDGAGHRCRPAGDRRWSCDFSALSIRTRAPGVTEWFAVDVGRVRRVAGGRTDDLTCFSAPCGTPEESLMPLAVGNSWTYRVSEPSTGRSYLKTIEIDRSGDIGGEKLGTTGFLLLRRDDRGSAHRWLRAIDDGVVWDADLWFDAGGRVERSTVYRPYRMRAPEGCRKTVPGARWTEDYDRIDTAADGARSVSKNREEWHMAGIETVEVPAGRFRALRFHRLNQQHRVDSTYWFAPGVGKIKEDSPPKEHEVLTSYRVREQQGGP